MTSRFYVIVRADLPPGARLAQSCHAAIDYGFKFPEEHRQWHEESNTIVCLKAEDANAIVEIAFACQEAGVKHLIFMEPDWDYEVTAIAVAPEGAELLRKLPLAD